MRATLHSTTFDPLGVVDLDLDPNTSFGTPRRRMNRVATLDGGAVFNDAGYSEADRTIKLVWPVTSAETEAAIERLVTLYAQLHVSTPRGFYLAAPELYTPGAATSSLTLLVVRKLSQD